MGDVGPAVSDEQEQLRDSLAVIKESIQDIHVLVTGFGVCESVGDDEPPNPSTNTKIFINGKTTLVS
ncbi:hypothetical protein ACJ72_08272 [Emergomyces africanus]|uniref:Uncharacterized protein n=1 Tax=Emergomyces africanus TaxID=1955775 RepID=A0A1B7NKR7_9EURO|nr:hypothetical protein ACJ72_08272 [Emergomyces africanus]